MIVTKFDRELHNIILYLRLGDQESFFASEFYIFVRLQQIENNAVSGCCTVLCIKAIKTTTQKVLCGPLLNTAHGLAC